MSAIAEDSWSHFDRAWRVKVLVADDDPAMREVLSHALMHEGYDVLTASNGKEALEIIRQNRPSIVITDALMPLMDGRELCRRVKEEAPQTRVVLMTSLYKSAGHKNEAFKVFGVDGFVAKPLDLAALIMLVNGFAEDTQ